MVPDYGFLLLLFTISVLWTAAVCNFFQVPGYNLRSSNYTQYLRYRWQYNSVQGIIVALPVNQTYMLRIYIYITKGKETNKMEAWLIFITYRYNLNKQNLQNILPNFHFSLYANHLEVVSGSLIYLLGTLNYWS